MKITPEDLGTKSKAELAALYQHAAQWLKAAKRPSPEHQRAQAALTAIC